MKLKINSDLGEGLNNEYEIMPFIQLCNIACGGHAGDSNSMLECIEIAIKNNVEIGAHPSYPDTLNFGRKALDISRSELSYSILEQINSLEIIASSYGKKLNHIKAHGALYNQMINDSDLSKFYLDTIKEYKKTCYLFVPYKSEIERISLKRGFKILYEVFGDRNYNDDLTLVSRDNTDALISDPVRVIEHIKNMIDLYSIKTISGKLKKIQFDTICIHSDTNNSIDILKRIKNVFNNSK